MDNESNNKDQEKLITIDDNNNNGDKIIDDTDSFESDETDSTDELPVEVQKNSSNGLSLWLAILACVAVAYLYYLHWQSGSDTDTATSSDLIQHLQDSDQVLSTDLQNAQVDISRMQQQSSQVKSLENQVQSISKQLAAIEKSNEETTDQNDHNQFDNSENASSLASLQQQLTEQSRIISEMQSSAGSQSNITQDTPPEYNNQIEKNVAIQVLLTTDVLLSTHRLPQAISALDNYLKISHLKPDDKNHLLRLLNQLQQINQVDTVEIEQQLQAVKARIDQLQVTTKKSSNDELKWYERFISVKKIETDNNINSTAQLVSFKTELNRLLYQAKLYLVLNDQAGWQNSLTDAVNWVQQEMPENLTLAERIKKLSQQTVVADLPEDLDVAAVIDELKGLH